MKTIAFCILTASLPSCASTIPAGTVLSAQSGKRTVAVDIGGKSWRDAFKAIGLQVGQAAANYALTEIQARLLVQSAK